MPVSNPGYFPPQRADGSIVGQTAGFGSTGDHAFLAGQNAGDGSTVADLIIIGYQAGVGPLTDADAAGCILIGSRTEKLASSFLGCADVAIGTDVAAAAANPMGANVLVGHQVLMNLNAASPQTFNQNVVIGAQACKDMVGPAGFQGSSTQNVIIGYQAMIAAGLRNAVTGSVVLGALACSAFSGGNGPSANIDNCVAIGRQAGQGWASVVATQVITTVAIGESAAAGLQSGGANVFIGAGSDVENIVSASGCTLVGQGTTTRDDDTVVVGIAAIATTDLSICIGARAGASSTADVLPGKICLEATNGSGTRYSALFGIMSTGNMILGNSTNTQREFAGLGATNILKLCNGTGGDTNPVDGGYFYVAAGALHWVGSGGTDTEIAPA